MTAGYTETLNRLIEEFTNLPVIGQHSCPGCAG